MNYDSINTNSGFFVSLENAYISRFVGIQVISSNSTNNQASIGEFATQLLVSASSEDSILAETINKIRKENTELIKQRASEEKKKALLAAQQHQISPDIMKMMDELSDQTW